MAKKGNFQDLSGLCYMYQYYDVFFTGRLSLSINVVKSFDRFLQHFLRHPLKNLLQFHLPWQPFLCSYFPVLCFCLSLLRKFQSFLFLLVSRVSSNHETNMRTHRMKQTPPATKDSMSLQGISIHYPSMVAVSIKQQCHCS